MRKKLYSGLLIILAMLLSFLLKINPYDTLVVMIAYWVLLDRFEKEDEK